MKFCPDCSNCLYIQESSNDESKNLENYCRNCGYVEKRTDNKIEKFQFEYEASNKNLIPEELVNDLTYARTRAVQCPNDTCATNVTAASAATATASASAVSVSREALFFKQKGTLKLTYICTTCKTMWK